MHRLKMRLGCKGLVCHRFIQSIKVNYSPLNRKHIVYRGKVALRSHFINCRKLCQNLKKDYNCFWPNNCTVYFEKTRDPDCILFKFPWDIIKNRIILYSKIKNNCYFFISNKVDLWILVFFFFHYEWMNVCDLQNTWNQYASLINVFYLFLSVRALTWKPRSATVLILIHLLTTKLHDK